MADVPTTQYAKTTDGVHIAYQAFGSGPPDLVVVPGFISHVEMWWELPAFAMVFRRLASLARVILFDKRGTGMSDPTAELPDIDRRMLDVLGVLDAVGSDRASILGISEGGAMALLFAATHPERTDSLMVYGSYARLTSGPDHPIGVPPERLIELGEYLEARWGTGVGLAGWAPSLGDDADARRTWARLQRASVSPGAVRKLVSSYNQIDVRPALPLIHVPTLVLHRTGDRMVPVELGREIAEGVDGARMVELPGEDHILTTETDGHRVIDEVSRFLTGSTGVRQPERVLATVLFTDIVGSTELATQMGDDRWGLVLDEHDRLVTSLVEQHGGTVVKGTGDGVLARFTGPTRAVLAALAITRQAPSGGLDVRAGVHTGELIERGDDVAGLSVHIAQRVSAAARSGEVLASRTVVDLVAGSGLEFEDRGEHELKGVEGTWRLYAAQG